jgi:hypothetical protein
MISSGRLRRATCSSTGSRSFIELIFFPAVQTVGGVSSPLRKALVRM